MAERGIGNEIDKVKEEYGENGRILAILLLREMVPILFEQIILNGDIDMSKTSDKEYLIEMIERYMESSPLKTTFRITMKDSFIQIANYAIQQKNNEVAIVLVVTAIEHILNKFIYQMLIRNGFKTSETNQLIRRTNVDEKTGWLMSFIGGNFPEDIKESIGTLVEMRNSIVHYKPSQWVIYDSDNPESIGIAGKLPNLDMSKIIEIVRDLEKALDLILKDLCPSYALANKLVVTNLLRHCID